MAYTRAWSVITPADVDQASTLGAAIRNLRLDIQERMDALLGAPGLWATDPIGPSTKVVNIPAIAGLQPVPAALAGKWSPDFNVAGDPYSMSPLGTSDVPWHVPVVVPVGATIKKVQAAFRVTSGVTTSIELTGFYVATPTASPNLTSLGSVAAITGVSALAWHDCGMSDHVVAAGDMFVAIINGHSATSASHFHGLEVTYEGL